MKFIQIYNLLCEDKIDDLILKYPDLDTFKDSLKAVYYYIPQDIKAHNKFSKYLEWHLNEIKQLLLNILPADTAKLIEETFDGYIKYNLKLENFKTLNEIKTYIETKQQELLFKEDENSKKIYEDEEKIILRIYNFKGMQKYGADTWCIHNQEGYWYEYILNGKNHYVIKYKTPKPIVIPKFPKLNFNKTCVQIDLDDNIYITDNGNNVGTGLIDSDANAVLDFMKLDKNIFKSYINDSEFIKFVEKNDNWERFLATAKKLTPYVVNVLMKIRPEDINQDVIFNIYAAQKNFIELQKMIDNGYDINENKSIYYAILERNPEVLEFLLKQPTADLNYKNFDGEPLLHTAIQYNNTDAINILLKNPKIDINGLSNDGMTPLKEAIEEDNKEIIKLLLSRPDIDINKILRYGTTAFHRACRISDLEVINMFLNHPDINPNILSDAKISPLLSTIKSQREETFSVLIAHPKVDVNLLVTDIKEPIIFYLIKNCGLSYNNENRTVYTKFFKMCVDSERFNLNWQNNNEYTLMHLVVFYGRTQMAEMILSNPNIRKRIDLTLEDKNGNTAEELAIKDENTEIINIFKKFA